MRDYIFPTFKNEEVWTPDVLISLSNIRGDFQTILSKLHLDAPEKLFFTPKNHQAHLSKEDFVDKYFDDYAWKDFCELYREDYECLGFPLPDQCINLLSFS